MKKPSSSPDVVARAAELLAAGKPQEALAVITGSRMESPEARNAKAVCLLRMGQVPQAAQILRPLVYSSCSVAPSPDAHVLFYTNYATAMMLQGDLAVAVNVLSQVPDQKHPAVLRLREALRRWRKGLSLGWRVLVLLGLYPARPVDPGSVPGDLP